MMFLSIDRIEDGYAVCVGEDGVSRKIALSLLPEGIREGDVLRAEGEQYILDRSETRRRRSKNAALQNKIKWE